MNKSQVTPIAILSALVVGIVATGFWIGSIFAPASTTTSQATSSVAAESTDGTAADESTDSATDAESTDAESTDANSGSATSDDPTSASAAAPTSESDLLVYLIEEEKLAYDVYVTLYDMWGSNVFTNISASEVTHQDRVAGLLDTAGVEDPRSSTVGVFVNPELQALYDQLVAQGSVSKTAAFEVGVAIEELDIADITKMLTTVTDPQIVSVLESLRSASENHLAAFQRQL